MQLAPAPEIFLGPIVYTMSKTNVSMQRKNRKRRGNKKPKKTWVKKEDGIRIASAPQAISYSVRSNQARVKQSGMDRIRVRHREFIGGLTTGTNTAWSTVFEGQLNPGLKRSFPWLSTTALNYENYKVNNLVVEYIPSVATNIDGQISLLIDYDAADSRPPSEEAFKNSQNAVVTSVWKGVALRSTKEQLNKGMVTKFTRDESISSTADLKTYDIGTLYVFSQGVVANKRVGDLYISYDIELITPQLNALVRGGGSFQTVTSSSTAKNQPFANAKTIGSELVEVVDGNKLKFKEVGEYLMDLSSSGTILSNYDFGGSTANYNVFSGLVGAVNGNPNAGIINNMVVRVAEVGAVLQTIVGAATLGASQAYISKISKAQYDELLDHGYNVMGFPFVPN